MLPRPIELKIWSFRLVYILQAHLNLNGKKWLDEMDWDNSEKEQKLLVLLLKYGRKIHEQYF